MFVLFALFVSQSLVVFIMKHGQELLNFTKGGYLTDTALNQYLTVVFVLVRGDCEND